MEVDDIIKIAKPQTNSSLNILQDESQLKYELRKLFHRTKELDTVSFISFKGPKISEFSLYRGTT